MTPHVRGRVGEESVSTLLDGITPACAGKSTFAGGARNNN